MLQIAQNKIDIYIDECVLEEIMSKDHDFIKKIKEPERYHLESDEEDYIVEMVMLNHPRIV